MKRKFADVVEELGAGNKAPVRALQAWQYLIGKASNRQIVTYKELKDMMGYRDARPLTQILGHVAYYCKDEGLPYLTVIVVNEDGVPGPGIPMSRDEIDWRREETFASDWFLIYPPSPKEFKAAWDRHEKSKV